jgi:hypothetical protein
MSNILEFCKSTPSDSCRYFDTKGNGEEWEGINVKYNKLQLLDHVKELLDQGQKVELYSLSRKEWVLAVKGSPGNQLQLLEFLQADAGSGSVIGCLRIKGDKVLLVSTDAQGEKVILNTYGRNFWLLCLLIMTCTRI